VALAKFSGTYNSEEKTSVNDYRSVHKGSIIIDGHCDSLGRVLEGQRRIGEFSELGQFDLPRAIRGGLTVELMATFFNDPRAGTGVRQTLQFIDVFFQELESYPDLAMQILNAKDIFAAKKSGKVGLMLSMEGAEGLEGDLSMLRCYYRLGLRCLGITWNRRNEAADGMDERNTGGGLTRFGKKLVAECETLGIVVDLSHLPPKGVDDVMQIAQRPVIFTHSNAYALWPHQRNLTDPQLEQVARKNGVVGVVPAPPFLGDDENCSKLDVLLDHVDHMVKVMGVNCVGFGGDFDGLGEMRVEGIEDVSCLENFTIGLLERGYSPEAVAKILGGNFLRVFEQVI
jgi:membrane dipeptidase